MFINYVHMNLIRMMKCRYRVAAISVAVTLILFFMLVFKFVFDAGPVGYLTRINECWHQIIIGNTAENVMIGFLAFVIIFTVCDYYKYRLYINIQNSYSNSVLFCASEISAMTVMALFLGIIPALMVYVTDFTSPRTLIGSGFDFLRIYFAYVICLFTSSMPVMFFAKLIKRVWPTVIVSFLQFFFLSFLLGFVTGFISQESPETTSNIVNMAQLPPDFYHLSSLFNPGDVFIQIAVGNVNTVGLDFQIIAVNTLTYVVLWFMATCLVSRKRVH